MISKYIKRRLTSKHIKIWWQTGLISFVSKTHSIYFYFIFVKEPFGQKFFLEYSFFLNFGLRFFDQNKFLIEKENLKENFGSNEILGREVFWSKKMFCQNDFLVKKNVLPKWFRSKKILVNKIFSSSKFLFKIFFLVNNFFLSK